MAGRDNPRPIRLHHLQDQLDTYRYFYNHDRPHLGISGQTPAQRFHATPKAQPAGEPIDLALPVPVMHIASRTVGANRRINIRSVTVYIGTRWSGQTVTAIAYGNRVVILHNIDLIAAITLEPEKTTYSILLPKS